MINILLRVFISEAAKENMIIQVSERFTVLLLNSEKIIFLQALVVDTGRQINPWFESLLKFLRYRYLDFICYFFCSRLCNLTWITHKLYIKKWKWRQFSQYNKRMEDHCRAGAENWFKFLKYTESVVYKNSRLWGYLKVKSKKHMSELI